MRVKKLNVIVLIIAIHLFISLFSSISFQSQATGWQWDSSLPPMLYPAVGYAEVYNGEIYHFGGEYIQVYTPSNNTWWVKGVISVGYQGDSAIIGDCVYIYDGGDVFYINLTSFSLHDISDPLSIGGSNGLVALNDTLFLVGGNDGGIGSDRMICYSSTNDTWWDIEPMITGRMDHEVVVFENEICAIGGFTSLFVPTLSVEKYNLTTKTWTNVSSINNILGGGSSTATSKNIIIENTGTSESYLPIYDSWIEGPDTPWEYMSHDHSMVTLNDVAYVVGGRLADDTPLDHFYRWDGLESALPNIEFVSPQDSSLVNETVNVTGTASDNFNLTNVEISLDETVWTPCEGLSNWYKEITVEPGLNTIFVRGTDLMGNINVENISVYYDVSTPYLNVMNPVNGSVTNTSNVTISGYSSDDWKVDKVEYSRNEYTWYECNGTANWSCTPVLYPGNNLLFFRATDEAGLTRTIPYYLEVDQTGPVVISSFPTNGSTNISKNINLTLEFNEPVNTTSCVATITPGNTGLLISSFEENDTVFKWQIEGFPDNTTIDFTFNCTDIYGNPMAEPFEMSFTTFSDYDNDGIVDEYDPDDDGDGVNDAEDAFPHDASEWADFDGDNIGDNADPDDDNDGVNDDLDAFPYDETEDTDTDDDGIGDNADPDDDNDGILDVDEGNPPLPEDYEVNYPLMILLLFVIAVCIYIMMFSKP